MNKDIINTLFRKSAAYLDIETLGTSASNPIHQASLVMGDRSEGFEYLPDPSSFEHIDPDVVSSDKFRLKVQDLITRKYSDWGEALDKYSDAWTRQQIKEGAYNHLFNPVASSRIAEYSGVTLPVSVVQGGDIRNITKSVLEKAKDKILWIANVSFEAKHLGLAGEMAEDEELNKLFTYRGKNLRDSMLVNDPGVLRARMIGQTTGDWTGVWKAVKQIDTSAPGIKPLDVQDLLRSAQSFGTQLSKKHGLGLEFDDLYRGTSLDIQATLMGFDKELHSGIEDNILTQLIGEKTAGHLENLETMLERAHHNTGASLLVENAEELDALNWLHKFKQVKNITSSIYARKAVSLAFKDKITAEATGTTFKHRMSVGNQVGYAERIGPNNQTVRTAYARPKVEDIYDFDEVIERIKRIPGNAGVDIDAIASEYKGRFSGMESSQALNALDEEINSVSAKVSEAVRKHNFGTYTPPVVNPINSKLAARTLTSKIASSVAKSTRNIKYLGGAFGLGLALVGLAEGIHETPLSTKVPNSNNPYNRIEGMSEDNYASYLRHQNTDFGSPYQGLYGVGLDIAMRLGLNAGAVYINNIEIDKRITDFRDTQMQTPLQKRIIESMVTKQSLKSMSSTYFLDPNMTTPIASGDYLKYGLNRNKKLQEVSLKDFDFEVEDADTLVLKSGIRGLMGKSMSIRLAGIDSPEIQHSDEAMGGLRIGQGQPHGDESRLRLQAILKADPNAKLIVDPTSDTYGRSLGVIVSNGKNINLQLVQEGIAGSLPFGSPKDDIIDRSAFTSAENIAYAGRRGMWQSNYWRAYKASVPDQNKITFNTLARVDKLAGNMNLAALYSTMELAEDQGMNQAVYTSAQRLKPKIAAMSQKKVYKDSVYRVNYKNDSKYEIEHLKLEVTNHMNQYGNEAHKLMKAKTSLDYNTNMVIDSLTKSSSIYHSKKSLAVTEYEEQAKDRKRLQGYMQRTANNSSFQGNRL